MKIAILTSGGDAPGMNFCLQTLVENLCEQKHDVYFVYKGYQGLIENDIKKVSVKDVKNISSLGGSIIFSFRSEEFLTSKGFEKAIKNYQSHKFDCLITIGGNGTLQGAIKLSNNGVKILFIPATIDNDLFYSERTLGFDTALNNVVDASEKIRQTLQASGRGTIIEVMGRECGDIALYSALALKAQVVITKESGFDYNAVLLKVKQLSKKRYENLPFIIVQENCIDINLLRKNLQNDLDIDFRTNVLGYIQRGGVPSIFDRIFALRISNKTVQNINENVFNVALGIVSDKIKNVDLQVAKNTRNTRSKELYLLIK